MMYSNRFIASVRVGGKILRENQGIVTLPFGSEYELLLKNMNSRRAMVKVTVDDVDITGGTRLIINPNDAISLERFIKDGNFSSGNKLKFIERTGGIEGHRGIKQEDGLLRFEFWAEQEAPQMITNTIVRDHYVDRYHGPYYWPYQYLNYGPMLGGVTYTSNAGSLSGAFTNSAEATGSLNAQETSYGRPQGGAQAPGSQVNFVSQSNSNVGSAGGTIGGMRSEPFRSSASPSRKLNQIQAKASRSGPTGRTSQRKLKSFTEQERSAPLNDAGITVPGSESQQKFYSAAGFALEAQSHVIVLQLRGEIGGVSVAKAVTVDHKPQCETCGKKNKANTKFCSDCGTALFTI